MPEWTLQPSLFAVNVVPDHRSPCVWCKLSPLSPSLLKSRKLARTRCWISVIVHPIQSHELFSRRPFDSDFGDSSANTKSHKSQQPHRVHYCPAAYCAGLDISVVGSQSDTAVCFGDLSHRNTWEQIRSWCGLWIMVIRYSIVVCSKELNLPSWTQNWSTSNALSRVYLPGWAQLLWMGWRAWRVQWIPEILK